MITIGADFIASRRLRRKKVYDLFAHLTSQNHFGFCHSAKRTKMCNKNSFSKMLAIGAIQFTGLAVILALCKWNEIIRID